MKETYHEVYTRFRNVRNSMEIPAYMRMPDWKIKVHAASFYIRHHILWRSFVRFSQQLDMTNKVYKILH